MVLYNFKTLAPVPTGKDFIDVILSKTQRKTPTVIHRGNKISQIRSFYMRKVKFTQTNFHEKTTQILEEFPRLDEIHPFYADLINVLYSRDHYKLALGQLSTARSLIDKIGKDYLHLIKFGDTLYRCKELKRAALGRMCTVMKKLSASLGYLEQVRQHLSRLPSIDPDTRTLLVTGYPNVGKSSFINKVSRANVDVQPYAFTTKSLFVGHLHYRYVPWQVIDTPGILDHPLEDRNTIEMQAITALAHLPACVLYFIDVSETCGYTIKKQVDLFHSIKPLFVNKPLLVVLTKCDLKRVEDLSEEDRKMVMGVQNDKDCQVMSMSNATEEGINNVKTTACDTLLAFRVERKLGSKRLVDVVNRIQITQPVKRDDKVRGVTIPDSVREARKLAREEKKKKKDRESMGDDSTSMVDADNTEEAKEKPKRKTQKDIELENGGPGVYNFDYRLVYQLEKEEWKWDVQPEIKDGKNIADFVDPDVDERLAELEKEEEELEAQFQEDMADRESDLDDDKKQLVETIKAKKTEIMQDNKLTKANNRPRVPRKYRVRKMEKVEEKLEEQGLDATKLRARSASRPGRKRGRTPGAADGSRPSSTTRSSSRPTSRPRSSSRALTPGEGYRNVKQKVDAEKLNKKSQKVRNQDARIGEGDRRYFQKKPKHLNTGKRGIGKTDRR